MSSPGSPPGTAAEQESSSGTREKAQEVAGQAQEKAQEAAGRAQDVVREQVDQRSTRAGERISGAAGDMRSVGEELRKQGKEGPAKIADQAADRTERLGSYLSESDADTVLSDLEDFGRRQPLAVLIGGIAIGIAGARFLKASSRRRYQGRIQSQAQTRELGVSADAPATAGQAPARPVGTPEAPPEAPVPSGPVVGR